MLISSRKSITVIGAIAAVGMLLAGCSTASEKPTDTTTTPAATSVEITDKHGTHKISLPVGNVIATDNRTFQTLSDWGVKLVAAPVSLMPPTNPYTKDSSIVNLGNHREPDLEKVVATEPDLIINGQRFRRFYDDLKTLAPEAVIIDIDPDENKPFDQELKRQVTQLGEIFGKQAEAKKLGEELDAAIARVVAAYDKKQTVMAVITSGGEINYAAPGSGRTLGPVFKILGLTPALEATGSSDHEGDDISVEAIAASNPDIILVMDRDAAIRANDPNYSSADKLIAGSAALKNVTAVTEGKIVYMPPFTYTNEGIQTYTTFFNQFADTLEGK